MSLDAITADTSIDEIFNSADAQEIISATLDNISDAVSARVQVITSCIKSSSFSSEIEGQAPLSMKANSISANYSNFLSELTSYFATIDSASVGREYEELVTLRSKIDEALVTLGDELEDFQSKIDNYDPLLLEKKYYNEAVNGKNRCVAKKEEYNEKLREIDKRISKLDFLDGSYVGSNSSNDSNDSNDSKTPYFNQIPSFEIGADGRPTEIPPNFQIDSHHRLNTPGIGAFAEAPAGRTYELHYDSATNLFYLGFSDDDWSDLSKFNNTYTPEEIKNSSIDGGVFLW